MTVRHWFVLHVLPSNPGFASGLQEKTESSKTNVMYAVCSWSHTHSGVSDIDWTHGNWLLDIKHAVEHLQAASSLASST